MIAAVVIGLAGFAAFVAVHIGLPLLDGRIGRGRLAQRLSAASVLLVGLLIAAASLAGYDWAPQSAGSLLVALLWGELTLLGLIVLYMPFVYTITHSLSLETLLILAGSREGSCAESDLAARFTSPQFVQARLDGMADNGYVEATETGCRLTRRAMTLARSFRWLKSVWGLGAGG